MRPRPPDRVLTLEELDRSRLAAWEGLCGRVGTGYFTGPVWSSCWHRSFGAGGRVRVGWWGPPDRPDAVAALIRVGEPLLPRGPGRPAVAVWRNLGSGPGGADHLGFPSTPELRDDVIAWALDRSGPVRLDNLSHEWAAPLASSGHGSVQRTRTYAVELQPGVRPGSKKLWKHIARSRRQLGEQGVVFEQRLGHELDRSLLEQLFSLHGIRSERVGRRTTFTHERLDFHECLASSSTEVHASFMVAARLDGRLVGALYGFLDPGRLHYYQSGWDPSFEKASLGSVLIGEAIEMAGARGAATFDFLRGDEPYKLRFGAEVHEDLSVLVPRGPGGRAVHLRDGLASGVAGWRERRARRVSD